MTGWELSFMLMGILIGIQIGGLALVLIGFVAEIYTFWQMGRDIAQMVTEKNHKRRLEMLAKMIELERAMQREAETKDQGDIDAAGQTEEARCVR